MLLITQVCYVTVITTIILRCQQCVILCNTPAYIITQCLNVILASFCFYIIKFLISTCVIYSCRCNIKCILNYIVKIFGFISFKLQHLNHAQCSKKDRTYTHKQTNTSYEQTERQTGRQVYTSLLENQYADCNK